MKYRSLQELEHDLTAEDSLGKRRDCRWKDCTGAGWLLGHDENLNSEVKVHTVSDGCFVGWSRVVADEVH